MSKEIKKVVLAYSGGLDTSVIVRLLIETYKCEVICFAADLGQKEELTGLKEKAINTGASKIYIEDLREEFVRDFVFPMFRATTVYEGEYLLGTSIARPLIAKRLIEITNLTNADAISHGATVKRIFRQKPRLSFQTCALRAILTYSPSNKKDSHASF